MKETTGCRRAILRTFQKNVTSSAARNPALSLVLVIVTCSILLPFISAIALTPLIAVKYVGDHLESLGVTTVVYFTCVQGLFLLFLIAVLFSILFMIATGADLLYTVLYTKYKLL